MSSLRFRLLKTQEFNEWFNLQTDLVQCLLLARFQRISVDGHFGFINYFDGLIKLKWKSGLRVYTARIGQKVIVILGGGDKNGQKKDIRQAKKVYKRIQGSVIGSS